MPRATLVAVALVGVAVSLYTLTLAPWLVIGCAYVALLIAVHRGAVDPVDE